MAGALIVTAEIGKGDFAWLNQLRRIHYPLERNQVDAHLTIFRALPPTAEGEIRRSLARITSGPRPRARIEGLMDLGSGVAFRVSSDDLDHLRAELAHLFHGLLSAQDAHGWQPHVTIQNKVARKEARALLANLEKQFRTRPLEISGLDLHRYMDGQWEDVAAYAFRGR